MAKKHKKEEVEQANAPEGVKVNETVEDTSQQPETEEQPQDQNVEESQTNKVEELTQQLEEMKDKYLRLTAEFDNYRKRTLKEKADLLKYASEEVLKDLLPVIDDLDRALKAIETANDIGPVKEGILLIVNKFNDFLKAKGVREIEAVGQELDTDLHEAITKIPVQDDTQRGKIVDVIQKGYLLHDKVMRYSKVVVGE